MNPVMIVRRFPLLSFYFLACLFGWSLYVVDFLTGGSGAENLPLGPLAATLVVVSCLGREQRRDWWRSMRTWRAAPRWYVLAVLAPATVTLLLVSANHALGAPWPTADQLADWPQMLGTFVAMLVFVGIGEEAGWVAFATPILLRRHSILVACLLGAVMRTLWHLPLMLSGDLSWVLGTVGNVGFSVVMTLLFVASGGRWTLVALWHATLNATGGLFFFRMVTGADHVRVELLLAGTYAVLAIVTYLAVRRHLSPPEDLMAPRERSEQAVSIGAGHGV